MKKLLLAVALSCVSALAQVPTTPAVVPHLTFVNNNGDACAGCSLFTYAAGTTTPQATYTDSSGMNQNDNPIILGTDGGANIWLGTQSYRLVLKDTDGSTVFSVDNVNSSTISACGSAGAIQASNTGGTGLTCDAGITINTSAHTLNVGTLPAGHVTIGALGTPTSWTFDTTTPATALASLGGTAFVYPGAGIGFSTGAAWGSSFNPSNTIPANYIATLNQNTTGTAANLSGTPALPNGTTAVTQAGGDNTTLLATDAFVLANVVTTPRICNANGCYRVETDGTIEMYGTAAGCTTSSAQCTATVTFPASFTTVSNLSPQITCVSSSNNCAMTVSGITTSGFTVNVSAVVRVGGGGSNISASVSWAAKGN